MSTAPRAIDADETLSAALDTLRALRVQKHDLETKERELTDHVKSLLGDEPVIVLANGRKAATYTVNEQSRIDTRRLKSDYPDLAEQLTMVTVVKRLTLAGDDE